MIWLLAQPLLLSREQVVSLSQSSSVSLVELTDGKGGGEVVVGKEWERSHIIRRQESLVLYKSSNNL
jgi:hypothetical protein